MKPLYSPFPTAPSLDKAINVAFSKLATPELRTARRAFYALDKLANQIDKKDYFDAGLTIGRFIGVPGLNYYDAAVALKNASSTQERILALARFVPGPASSILRLLSSAPNIGALAKDYDAEADRVSTLREADYRRWLVTEHIKVYCIVKTPLNYNYDPGPIPSIGGPGYQNGAFAEMPGHRFMGSEIPETGYNKVIWYSYPVHLPHQLPWFNSSLKAMLTAETWRDIMTIAYAPVNYRAKQIVAMQAAQGVTQGFNQPDQAHIDELSARITAEWAAYAANRDINISVPPTPELMTEPSFWRRPRRYTQFGAPIGALTRYKPTDEVDPDWDIFLRDCFVTYNPEHPTTTYPNTYVNYQQPYSRPYRWGSNTNIQ